MGSGLGIGFGRTGADGVLISEVKKDLAVEKIFVSLHSIWSPKHSVAEPARARRMSAIGVKRETGGNPVQSRCCELRQSAARIKPLCVAIGAWEGRAAESKSEDLPSQD